MRIHFKNRVPVLCTMHTPERDKNIMAVGYLIYLHSKIDSAYMFK
jgi:hypothetical protein